MTTAYTETPRIYVASLSDYNAGRLHGAWIDLDPGMTADDVHDQIAVILHTSPTPMAEEWAIHDYENFEGIQIDEYESIDRIISLSEAINEHGAAFAAWSDSTGHSDASEFADAYQGLHDSEKAFAESMLDGTGMLEELPEWARSYFDIEAWTRDLFMGDYFSIQAPDYSGFWIFANN